MKIVISWWLNSVWLSLGQVHVVYKLVSSESS